MQRQLRRGGGIMNIAPREQFGLGSKLKRAVRKIIPNEVSKIAVKAAPFVAPFNPQLAAAMAGIGSFDQTGSIGDSLKSAAITYGGGQLARYAGGAGFQQPGMGNFGLSGFSSPIGTSTGFGKMFGGPKTTVKGVQPLDYSDMSKFNELGLGGSGGAANIQGGIPSAIEASEVALTGNTFQPQKFTDLVNKQALEKIDPTIVSKTVTESAPKSVIEAIRNQDYFEAAKIAAEKGAKSLFTTPITDAQGNVTGSKLDKTMLLAAGTAGLSYLDAKKLADEMGEDIGTEEEYDEATKEAKRAEYSGYLTNFFEGKKDGGRIGFNEGGEDLSDDPGYKGWLKLYEKNPDAAEMNTDHAKYLSFYKRTKEAQGGRIGFADGTDKKLKEILEMDMTIPKSRNDPRNMTTNEIIFAIEDGRATPEMFEELLLRDVGGISALMLDEIGGKKFDEPKKVYQFNPSESSQGGAIENLLFKLRESNPDIYGEYSRPRLEKGPNFFSLPREVEAEGGRIGYMFGDKVEDEEGIMSMSDEKDENMKMAYFPGDVFSKAEISRLFRDKSLTTNQDRKQLFRILMNPGMFPEAEEMLKKMLRGKQDGGRIGYGNGSRPSQLFKLLEEAEAAGDMDKVKEIKSDLFREFGLKLAKGGRINYNMGSEVPVRKNKAGIEELDYRESGGFVPIGVKERADDVPAMLSKNEFVLTADAVRGIGGGDVEKGAEKLYGVMKQAEKVGRA